MTMNGTRSGADRSATSANTHTCLKSLDVDDGADDDCDDGVVDVVDDGDSSPADVSSELLDVTVAVLTSETIIFARRTMYILRLPGQWFRCC